MNLPGLMLIIKRGDPGTDVYLFPELYKFTGMGDLIKHLGGGQGARWSSAQALKTALGATERFFDFYKTEGLFCHSDEDIIDLLSRKKPVLISFDPREPEEGEKTDRIDIIVFPMKEKGIEKSG